MEAQVLERPLIEQPEELKKLRDKNKKIIYSQAVQEREGELLPQTAQELQEMWDNLLKEVIEEKEEKEERESEKVPNIVLKELTDNDKRWTEELGWPKEDRNRVKRALIEVLGLEQNAADHALGCIVASGKKPDEIVAFLTRENYSRKREEISANYGQYNISETEKDLTTKALFLEELLGGLKDKTLYIKRFVLAKEFDTRALPFLQQYGGLGYKGYGYSLSEEFYGKLPDNNMFDVAWNIGYEKKEQKDIYGIDADFPILRMQVAKDKDGNVQGRYVVDEANFVEWLREQIWRWYDEIDTDEVTDYFSKIKIDKGQYYSIDLANMLFNKKYFRDEDGHFWGGLWNQVFLEPWIMFFMRTYFLQYKNARGSEEDLMKTIQDTHKLSKATRKIGGTSMIGLWATLPLNFKGQDSDTDLGEAFQKMFTVYYNMADFDQLQKLLGDKSDFFTRDHWMKAIMEITKKDLAATGMPRDSGYLSGKIGSFDKAFRDENGNVTKTVANKKAFIEWLNYLNGPVQSSTWIEIIDTGIKALVKDAFTYKGKDGKDKVKESDLNYAWLMAHSWKYFAGAEAKNNAPSYSGHNAETKWIHAGAYAKKYADNYAGGGNPFFIPMVHGLSLPMLEGLALEDAFEPVILGYDGKGEPIYSKNPREKNPMEILLKMREISQGYEDKIKEKEALLDQAADEQTRIQLLREIFLLKDKKKNQQKQNASKLVFKEDAMKNFSDNIVGRAKVLFEQLLGGQEIKFDDFVTYDSVFRGVSFNREKWQKELQGRLVTPLRYLFEANGATQLNAMRRFPDAKGNWQDISVAESMMGHQVLNIPEFRKRISDVTKEQWKEMKRKGYRRRGIYIIRPDGKHEINADRVQNNKRLAWQEWMLAKLGADLYQHISRHSTDPAYNMGHFMKILKAIEELPGDLVGNEFNMKKTHFAKTFFSKEQMRRLKFRSGTTTTALFTRQFFADLFFGDKRKKETLFGESFSIFLSTIFKGY